MHPPTRVLNARELLDTFPLPANTDTTGPENDDNDNDVVQYKCPKCGDEKEVPFTSGQLDCGRCGIPMDIHD
jgi:ribosomal protein S27AE